MADPSQASNLLDTVPDELLLHIKSFIPPQDICTHVWYSRTIARTAPLYEESEWRKFCRLNGLGTKAGESQNSESFWKDMAYECVSHATNCDQPGCGLARLDSNMEELQEYIAENPEWGEQMEALKHDGHNGVEPSDVVRYLAFRGVRPHGSVTTAYLRENERGIHQLQSSAFLTYHPVASRSFVTFPPAHGMSVDASFTVVEPVYNENGVTLWDLQMAMEKNIDRILNVHEATDLFTYVEDRPLDAIFPSTWPIDDIFRATVTLRSWLRCLHWAKLELIDAPEPENGAFHFSMTFRSKQLPNQLFDIYSQDMA